MSNMRYIRNTASRRPVPDTRAELITSLMKLIQQCPPTNPWPKNPKGIFSGPTSIAYLFLRLSRTHPNLRISNRSAKGWCEAYLDCGSNQLTTPAGLTGWGVMNEYLSFHAVRAAAFHDDDSLGCLEHVILQSYTCPDADNDYLYGRAGALALLHLVQMWRSDARERMQACIDPLIEALLRAIPWNFRGKAYTGAAHGVIGILTQIVSCRPSLGRHPQIENILAEQLDLQTDDGHWPSKMGPRMRPGDLVQFCHGSPGFILSLPYIRPTVRESLQQRIDVAIERGRKEIWEKGLLRKEPNLCHGIVGNMLALGDWVQREHFMAYATASEIAQNLRSGRYIAGDDPFGLFWGEAGRAWGWAMLDARVDLGFPVYSDRL
ncbi:hypothetical protein NUU61_004431 [Penicillium alfredii]|uniref:Uncharacterized protein n=1 Tax=Penicillium alfredii TaxID=1506179 RepID=A0A9W9KDC9_9EURO|nr:uncharacterized protein NUU61_004431 [Penicillium alfredii]KAJ5102209.1 hypothetical protein NUU61_004431 [Penicillium alfredii]